LVGESATKEVVEDVSEIDSVKTLPASKASLEAPVALWTGTTIGTAP
jgi:hypothetical protein